MCEGGRAKAGERARLKASGRGVRGEGGSPLEEGLGLAASYAASNA